MRRYIATLLAMIALSAFSVTAHAQEVDKDLKKKAELTEKIMEVLPPTEPLDKAIAQFENMVPQDRRALYRSVMKRTVDAQKLEAVAKLAMTEIFTLEELEEMYAYESTPEAKSIRGKMPQYQEKLKPVIEQMVREAMVELQKNGITLQ